MTYEIWVYLKQLIIKCPFQHSFSLWPLETRYTDKSIWNLVFTYRLLLSLASSNLLTTLFKFCSILFSQQFLNRGIVQEFVSSLLLIFLHFLSMDNCTYIRDLIGNDFLIMSFISPHLFYSKLSLKYRVRAFAFISYLHIPDNLSVFLALYFKISQEKMSEYIEMTRGLGKPQFYLKTVTWIVFPLQISIIGLTSYFTKKI